MAARLILLVCLMTLGVAAPALAQTSFSTDCNSNVTITGAGLTLTAPSGTVYYGCRAGNPKFAGKWYYTYTPSALNSGAMLGGLASNASVVTGLDVTQCVDYINHGSGCGGPASIAAGNGSIFYSQNFIISGTGTSTVGAVSAIAADLDTDPPQFWFTANANGTSGFAGGPLWNGSASSSPEVPGTGLPTPICAVGASVPCGTGAPFLLTGQIEYPLAFMTNSGAATFNFGTFSPFTTLLPDYSAWNTSGGLPAVNPISPLESQISNASGWAAGTYAAGARVNAGPAWNGSAYTSGLKLCLFGLVTPGTSGSDPTVFNTACTSGTPSNRGGIPGGAWPGATTVTDGGVTWALLTVVDEISVSAASSDTNTPWAQSTAYINGAYVLNGGNAYVNAAGTASPCTSASSGSGPSSTTFNAAPVADGTCSWSFRAKILYSSHNAMPPHQFAYGTDIAAIPEISLVSDIHFNLWWGGTGAPKYWAGHGGENDPITLSWDLQDQYGENTVGCWHGNPNSILTTPQAPPTLSENVWNCNGRPWLIRYQPAPGDGFSDNAPNGPLGTGDSSKGVMFYSNSSIGVGGNPPGSATLTETWGNFFSGMQVYSVNGAAIGGSSDTITPGWASHTNALWMQDSILYAGGQGGVTVGDSAGVAVNNLFIYAGTNVPCYGMGSKFEATVAFNTFVGPGAGNVECAAIFDMEGAFYTSIPLQKYGNAIFGFAIPYMTLAPFNFTPGEVGGNNTTDVPASYTGSTFSFSGSNYQGSQLVGTSVNSASASAAFVNPTVGASLDMRVKNTSSPLYGAAASFVNTFVWFPALPPTVDIFSQSRPSSGRWDVGAQQFQPGVTPTVLRLKWLLP